MWRKIFVITTGVLILIFTSMLYPRVYGLENTSAMLRIMTTPVTKDFPIVINNSVFKTDDNGVLCTNLPRGLYSINVPAVYVINETTRVVFKRWLDGWQQNRTINLVKNVNLTLGLTHYHPVSLKFFDAFGENIPENEIDRVELMSSNGDHIILTSPYENIWLSSNHLRRAHADLLAKTTTYRIYRVVMHGKNVVYRGQQIFNVTPNGIWEISLLVFPLEVHVTDFILNTPIKCRVFIYDLYGDKNSPLYIADALNGTAYFPKIPRGDYEIRIDGGISLPTPLIFRRPTIEYIKVITPSICLIIVPIGCLFSTSIILLKKKPEHRNKILAVWLLLITFAIALTQIIPGNFSGRFISMNATPIYGSDEKLIGFRVEIYNNYFAPVSLTYKGSDVEIKIYNGTHLWTATLESPELHDEEMGDLKIVSISPGLTHHIIALYPLNEEWNIYSKHPLMRGDYYVFIRLYGISVPILTITLQSELPKGFTEEEQIVDIPYQQEP
ncbi:MAG: hypothetical protein QXU43_07840 [Thermoproteota archaeon]